MGRVHYTCAATGVTDGDIATSVKSQSLCAVSVDTRYSYIMVTWMYPRNTNV
jgi:hypothetical protein